MESFMSFHLGSCWYTMLSLATNFLPTDVAQGTDSRDKLKSALPQTSGYKVDLIENKTILKGETNYL